MSIHMTGFSPAPIRWDRVNAWRCMLKVQMPSFIELHE